MVRVNIREAKAHLSRYRRRVEAGEVIWVCRRDVPVAEIRALPKPAAKPRPVGLAKGRLKVTKSFFEPLPPGLVRGFRGKGA